MYNERIKTGKSCKGVALYVTWLLDRDELGPKATADSSAQRRQYLFPYMMEEVHSWLASEDTGPWMEQDSLPIWPNWHLYDTPPNNRIHILFKCNGTFTKIDHILGQK